MPCLVRRAARPGMADSICRLLQWTEEVVKDVQIVSIDLIDGHLVLSPGSLSGSLLERAIRVEVCRPRMR